MMFSRALAYAGGVLLPILETVRRWHQLGDPWVWPFWLDDWIIGLFLIYGAWRTRSQVERGRPILAAAWGFACGLGYASFFSDLVDVSADPSGLPSTTVAALKGAMLALGLAALVATIRSKEWR